MTTLWQYSPEDAWLFGDDEIDDAAELALTPSASGLSAAAFVQNEFFNPSDGIRGELDEVEDGDTLVATGTVVSPPGVLPDPFNGTSLQTGWEASAPLTGTSLPTVGSGVASGALASALWGTNFDTGSNPYAEVIIPTAPADYTYSGVLFMDGTTGNGYIVYYKREPGAQDQIVCEEIAAGSSTGTVGSFFFNDVSFPITLRVSYNPATDTFSVTINGVLQGTTFTDSTYGNLTRPGLVIIGQTVDQFDAGPMPASGGITATLAGTEGDDTVAASAALRISGSLTATEANDTLTATSALAIAGGLSATESDDALAATAGLRLSATLGVTEADDTLTATGTVGNAPIAATLAITEADDTLSGTASLRIAAALPATEANDTLAATAAVRISASLIANEADDTLSAAAALRLSASLSGTEANDTLSASDTLRIAGSLAATEADDALSATGLIGNAPITATVAVTEANDTLAATAGLRVSVALSATEGDDTLAATATLRIAATVVATEANDTLAAAGTIRIAGGLAVAEADDILTAIAVVLLRGQLAVTEADDTLSAAAHLAGAVTRFVPLTLDERDGDLAVAERDRALIVGARGVLLTVSKTHGRDLELSDRPYPAALTVRQR